MENVPCDLCSPCDLVLVVAVENHHTVVLQIDLVHDASLILFNLVLTQEVSLGLLSHQLLMALKFRHTILHDIFVIGVEVKFHLALLLLLLGKLLCSLIQLCKCDERWQAVSIHAI